MAVEYPGTNAMTERIPGQRPDNKPAAAHTLRITRHTIVGVWRGSHMTEHQEFAAEPVTLGVPRAIDRSHDPRDTGSARDISGGRRG